MEPDGSDGSSNVSQTHTVFLLLSGVSFTPSKHFSTRLHDSRWQPSLVFGPSPIPRLNANSSSTLFDSGSEMAPALDAVEPVPTGAWDEVDVPFVGAFSLDCSAATMFTPASNDIEITQQHVQNGALLIIDLLSMDSLRVSGNK